MKPNIERKNVRECLDFWAQAEKKQKTLSFNDHDEIHVVYDSVTEHAPELQRELMRLAVLRMVAKIQTELREFAVNARGKSAEELMMKLPSLGQFTASGKLGNLREEWQKLQNEGASNLLAVATERQNIFNEFRGLLPQMPTHFENDGTAILRNDFRSGDHQKILREEIEAVNKYKLNNEGYYQTFIDDLPRTHWNIDIDGKTQFFGHDKADENLQAIKEVFGQNKVAIGTVSKIMNQVSPGLVKVPNFLLFPPDLDTHIKDAKHNNEKTFFRISSIGNCINFEGCTYSKAVKVAYKSDQKDEKIWLVNADGKWQGAPGPKNYGQLYRLSMKIDKEAASNGILKPVDGTQIEALYEIRLCPEVRRII